MNELFFVRMKTSKIHDTVRNENEYIKSFSIIDLPLELRIIIVSYTNISSSSHVLGLSCMDVKQAACMKIQRAQRSHKNSKLKVGDYVCVHRKGRWIGVGVVDEVSEHNGRKGVYRVKLQKKAHTHYVYLYPRSDVDASYSYFTIRASDPIFLGEELIHD